VRSNLPALRSWIRGERGVATMQIGLLVAPLLVAAVFAGAVMRTGALSTRQFELVADSALRQTGSGIELRGSFYARTNGTSITQVQLLVETTPGGTPIDLNPVAPPPRQDRSVVRLQDESRA